MEEIMRACVHISRACLREKKVGEDDERGKPRKGWFERGAFASSLGRGARLRYFCPAARAATWPDSGAREAGRGPGVEAGDPSRRRGEDGDKSGGFSVLRRRATWGWNWEEGGSAARMLRLAELSGEMRSGASRQEMRKVTAWTGLDMSMT